MAKLSPLIRRTDIQMKDVVKEMLGRNLDDLTTKKSRKVGNVLLDVQHISDGKRVTDVSLSVKKGEIIGIAGLVGAGKTELSKLLSGAAPLKAGTISVSGKKLKFRSPADAIAANIVYIPEERRKEGLFMDESISTNLTFPYLKKFSTKGFLQKKKEQDFSRKMVEDLQIKSKSIHMDVNYLSGGNQQKVVIGKWLSQDAEIMIFDEPTKGVDIGAKQEIYQLIENMAADGKGIIYCSCEMSELLAIADRILVMVDGRIVKDLDRKNATQELLLLYASGGKEEHHERKIHTISI